MIILLLATACAGLFAGAALYVTAVEHPARLSCGTELAVREFGPSYRRASVLQASLAIAGGVTGLLSAWLLSDLWIGVAALLLVVVVPYTLIVVARVNNQLMDPALDPRDPRAAPLLARWGQLHAVRTVLSIIAFVWLVARLTIAR